MSFEYESHYHPDLRRYYWRRTEGHRSAVWLHSYRLGMLPHDNTRLLLIHKLTGHIVTRQYPLIYPLIRTAYDRMVDP